jgi:hypothetical protein
MRFRKFLSLLLAFCVMLATFPGGAALAFGAKDAAGSGSHSMTTCHDAMDSDAGSHDRHDAPADAAQPQHNCCTGFVGILSTTAFSPVMPHARETPLFLPSLRLLSRTTGIYRPPRQHA